MAKDKDQKAKQWLKYGGLASQLAAYLLVGFFLGQWLDRKVGTEQPYITLTLLVVCLIAYCYSLFRQLIDPK